MLHWQMLQINWNTVMWAATANVWVSRPALNPLHHKSTPSVRQTESDLVHTTLLPPFYYWVAPSLPWTRTRRDTQLANSWLPPTADSQPLAADSQPLMRSYLDFPQGIHLLRNSSQGVRLYKVWIRTTSNTHYWWSTLEPLILPQVWIQMGW